MVLYPKKQPKKATFFTIASIVIAAIMYALGDIGIGPRAMFQLTSLILFAVGIMLMSRYLLTDYKYVISEEGETRYLIIIKISGKRQVEMAKFDIKEVYALGRYKKVRDFEAENGKVSSVYNYTTNLMPANEYHVAVTFNGKKILLRLEGDEEFFNLISNR